MKHQNKVFRTIMALAATAILAASCAKEVMTKDEFFEGLYEKCTIEADATLPGSGDADSTANTDKAYLDGSGKVIWQSGDQLNINGTPLTVATIDSGGVRAKFYGTVNGIVSGNNLRFWAVYPPSLSTQFTNPNNLTFTLPSTQTYNPSKQPLEGYSYMVGYTEVPQDFHRLRFQMRNMGSVLKLTLKANANDFRKTVDKIEFTSNANLAGTFTVNNNSSSPTISQGSGSSTTLVVNFSGGLDISSQKTIYVFLPPLSGKSLNMKIYGGYGLVSYVEVNKTSASLERNKIYSYENKNITFDKVFTVANNNGTIRKVIFSPGNLQWSRTNGTASNTTHTVAGGGTAAGTWRFAPNQYTVVGKNNKNISSTYTGWIDLFGWGTSGYNNKHPYMTTATNTNYGPASGNINSTNYDWGVYNAILNTKTGTTDAPGTWRTMTKDEWDYVMFTRSGNRYTKAELTDRSVKGIILFPDGFTKTNYSGVTWSTINGQSEWGTKCTNAGWTTLERLGCVFIPVLGYRDGTTVSNLSGDTYQQVYRWTSTSYSTSQAWHLFSRAGAAPAVSGTADRHWGCGVRLVRTHP